MLPDMQSRILDLNARYAQAIDDDRLEEWPAFFTEAARYVVTTAENFEQGLPLGMIYATSRAMLQDRVRSLNQRPGPAQIGLSSGGSKATDIHAHHGAFCTEDDRAAGQALQMVGMAHANPRYIGNGALHQ